MISHGVTEGGEVSVFLKQGEIAIEVTKKSTRSKKAASKNTKSKAAAAVA